MPNQYNRQILADGPRNAQLVVTGFVDSMDAVLVPLITLSEFLTNDLNLNLVGLRVDEINYSLSPGVVINLTWEAAIPQLLAELGSGVGKLCFDGGIFPDRTKPGYTGTINMTTSGATGMAQPAGFTLYLGMIKLYSR